MPNWMELATLWMATNYTGKPAVIVFHPFSDHNDIAERWAILDKLGISDPAAVSAEFVVSRQESLQAASLACNNIPDNLMFAMVWDGNKFTDEN